MKPSYYVLGTWEQVLEGRSKRELRGFSPKPMSCEWNGVLLGNKKNFSVVPTLLAEASHAIIRCPCREIPSTPRKNRAVPVSAHLLWAVCTGR